MALKLIYITDDQKEFVRCNSEKYAPNTMVKLLNVPLSEIMNIIVTEKLPGVKKNRNKKI